MAYVSGSRSTFAKRISNLNTGTYALQTVKIPWQLYINPSHLKSICESGGWVAHHKMARLHNIQLHWRQS